MLNWLRILRFQICREVAFPLKSNYGSSFYIDTTTLAIHYHLSLSLSLSLSLNPSLKNSSCEGGKKELVFLVD